MKILHTTYFNPNFPSSIFTVANKELLSTHRLLNSAGNTELWGHNNNFINALFEFKLTYHEIDHS